MSGAHQQQPFEFSGEMPEQYEEEEYYGEEEEYAEDGEHEEYEDEAPVPAKPKSNIVRTAIFALTGVIALTGIAYVVMMMVMPDTLNDIVNNIPFMSHPDAAALDASGAATGKGTKPAASAAAGTDVANVPPDPGKAAAMKPRKKAADDEGASGAAPATTANTGLKPNRPTKAGLKPATVAAVPNGAPMEGVPMEGVPAPAAKPTKPTRPGRATKPVNTDVPAAKPAANPVAAAKPVVAAKPIVQAKPKVISRASMAAARAAWMKKHPRAGAAMVARAGRGAFLGYGSRVIWVHGRPHRQWAPMYAVVRQGTGRYPLARHRTIAALPASWKRLPRGHYAVQIGSFSNTGNASQLVSQLRAQGITAYTTAGPGRARVFIGSYANREAAAVKMQQLQAQGIPAAVTNH